MNYGSDPADQIVRFTLEGTEVALKLSGLAAKNFALFVYAVLKDQKKTRGKTRLVRMLKEQRPFKFFNVPAENMKEFAREAKEHGLLYVPIRNKQKSDRIEVVVFADDASKIQRIYDNLGLDYVAAQAGEAAVEKAPVQERQSPVAAPRRTETVQTEHGVVEFEVGGFADEIEAPSAPSPEENANFTAGRELELGKPSTERNPSGPSSPSKSSSPGLTSREEPEQMFSVKKQLREIRQEQAEKKASKTKQQDRQHPVPGHSRQKKKQKGR